MAERGRRRLELGEEGEAVEQLLAHVREQVGVAEPPIKVVGDVAAVHDLAEDVPQVVPRDLRAVLEVVGRDCDAHAQVALVERVGAVPADRAELAPLAHD